MTGPPKVEDTSLEAAKVQARNALDLQQNELFANRPDINNPFGTTTWDQQMIDPATGRPVVMIEGRWYHSDVNNPGNVQPGEYLPDIPQSLQPLVANPDYVSLGYGPNVTNALTDSPVMRWQMNQTLTPEWQNTLDMGRRQVDAQIGVRQNYLNDWANNPVSFSGYGNVDIPGNTISRGDLGQFGTTSPNMQAGDWRQFGTTGQTIGADQWQNQGYSNPTIGADDWQQIGMANPLLTGSTYDERFGQAGDHGYGDHNMGGADWDYIQYAPEAIRAQAEQQTLNFMNAQLDPQWDNRREQLEIQLRNQGLQWGDQAWDNAISSFERQRNLAYENARNQALADSRAEAAMLWDQEMGRSNQKNFLLQSDIDNEFQARQANIANYLSGRGQDIDSYLAYQQAAFGQDLSSRQQGLDAQRQYGQLAFDQDFAGRQQALDAQLAYGREAYGQDYATRQQQLDANRLYSQQAFEQDLAARQAAISNYLNYGSTEFNQGLQGQQLGLDAQQLALQAAMAEEQMNQARYGLANPNETMATITSSVGV